MTTLVVRQSPLRRFAVWLHEHPRGRLALLLAAPLLWLVVAHLWALGGLFLHSIWQRDEFTGLVRRGFSLGNFREIIANPPYPTPAPRALAMAAAATVPPPPLP